AALGGAAALALLAACSEPAKPPPAPPPAAPAAPPPPVVTPPPPRPAPDPCGAQPLQYLVGKPRTQIPVPVDPSRRRVVCSTCATTQDHVPSRQTIIYDSNTDLVRSVRCG
ncbi:MAG TPA: proteinase inhibitor i78, partial [Caulobacteraceae bacterium]